MNKNNKISIIHTPCKNCVFAKFEDITQTDCELDYIKKYRNLGIEILEVYDDEKNFFVINNKKCLGYRDDKWLQKQKSQTIDYLITKIQSENLLKYITIINLDKEDTKETFLKYVNNLSKQFIQPKGILISKKSWEKYAISNKEIMEVFQNLQSDIKWRIQNFVDRDMDDNQMMESIIKSCPIDRFYLLANLKKCIPTNSILNIQKFIDSGKNFGCIDIDTNLFFSYITVQYCKTMRNIDLLQTHTLHTKYETID
jgi:hypothetical protein